MTVETLYELCKKEIEKGNGKKDIILNTSDGKNGVYTFTSLDWGFSSVSDNADLDYDNAIYDTLNALDYLEEETIVLN